MLAHAVSLTHPHSFSASSIVHEHKVMDECNITPSPIHAFACSPVHNVRRLSSVYVLLFSFIHLFWILNCFRYSLEHRICQAQPPRRGNSNGRSQRKAVLLSFIFFPFLFLSIIFVLHLWVSLLYFFTTLSPVLSFLPHALIHHFLYLLPHSFRMFISIFPTVRKTSASVLLKADQQRDVLCLAWSPVLPRFLAVGCMWARVTE